MYADIPVPVLEVPRGEEGWPRGLSNPLEEDDKQEDEEDKEEEEDGDDEEEQEGKRRDEEDMQHSLVVEEGMIFQFPMHIPLQGSFQQEEGKQSHRRDTQKYNHQKLYGAS